MRLTTRITNFVARFLLLALFKTSPEGEFVRKVLKQLQEGPNADVESKVVVNGSLTVQKANDQTK